jgi:hypothetical protein
VLKEKRKIRVKDMKFVSISGNGLRWALLALMLLVNGCGGGTTGTSSTGELKFAGYIQDSTGERIVFTPMLVRSGVSETPLLTAATNSEGSFDMSLPGSEAALMVEIEGKRSAPLNRSYAGSSQISTVITKDLTGDLTFSGSFEGRIDPDSLCSSFGIEDNGLFQQAQISSQCLIRIFVASSDYPLTSFIGALDARCGSEVVTVATSAAGLQGVVELDLATALAEGCSPRRLLLLSELDNSRAIEFTFR